jgi:large subunit ribosomal protein L10
LPWPGDETAKASRKEVNPLPVSKQKKQETIEELKEMLGRSHVVVLSEYRGLTAAQMSHLRNKLRPMNSKMLVAKNTLVLKSLEELGLPQPQDLLQGPTALGMVFGDMGQPVRAILDFARENEFFKVKGGMMGARLISPKEVQILPQLPTTEVLRAQALGGVVSPIAGFVGVLDGALRGLLYALDAHAEQLGQPS